MLGVDVEEVRRFRVHDFSKEKRFWRNIFTAHELRRLRAYKDPYPHADGIFAAKEAVKKACSGRASRVSFLDIEVRHEKSGRPFVSVRRHPELHCEVSIAHTRDLAVAVALCENIHDDRRRTQRKN